MGGGEDEQGVGCDAVVEQVEVLSPNNSQQDSLCCPLLEIIICCFWLFFDPDLPGQDSHVNLCVQPKVLNVLVYFAAVQSAEGVPL